jgi:hypothetical protein
MGGVGILAAALWLEACGKSKQVQTPPAHSTAAAVQVRTLNRLLDLEHRTIAAYTAGIPLLPKAAVPAAQQFLTQELSHAGELSGLVRQAGGKPHKPRPSYNFGHPKPGHDLLRLIHELESAQLAAYLLAMPTFTDPPVRAATAAILGNDAQHVALLRAQLGRPPVPAAFVTGHE